MCGRYQLSSPPADVAAEFGIDVRDNFPPRWNIAPTQPIGVVRTFERQREFALMRWGFIPSWAGKEYLAKMGSKPLINARSETASEKPTFRNAWRRRRCLVPADGFYEWKSEKGVKQPYLIQRQDKALFAFAGLWETAIDPDGGEMDTVAILTAAAGPDLSGLHGREPIVVRPEDYDIWLDPDETKTNGLMALSQARGAGFWAFQPVSTAVNSVRSEGEALASPIGQGDLFG